jgi:hypothetical protein
MKIDGIFLKTTRMQQWHAILTTRMQRLAVSLLFCAALLRYCFPIAFASGSPEAIPSKLSQKSCPGPWPKCRSITKKWLHRRPTLRKTLKTYNLKTYNLKTKNSLSESKMHHSGTQQG